MPAGGRGIGALPAPTPAGREGAAGAEGATGGAVPGRGRPRLIDAKAPDATAKVVALLKSSDYAYIFRGADLLAKVAPTDEIRAFEKKALAGNDWQITTRVLRAISANKDTSMREAVEKIPAGAPNNVKQQAEKLAAELKGS